MTYQAEELVRKLQSGAEALKKILSQPYLGNERECIVSKDKLRVYRYANQGEKKNKTPILIVFATVNRPEILDLLPDTSFIKHLLKYNQEVYLLDWGYPDDSDADSPFSDYIVDKLDFCVKELVSKTKYTKINLLGICQGGLISLCYAAMNNNINSLTLISTPIDFHQKNNLISSLLQQINIGDFRSLPGNVSGSGLTHFFISLRPFELLGKKYLRFVNKMQDSEMTEKFLRVEKWLHDAPDQPRLAFAQFVEEFYHANKLVKEELTVAEHLIDLNKINIPVLNIIADKDEIIPPSASTALRRLINREYYSQRKVTGGHIGIYVNPKTASKLAKSISAWLAKR